MIPCTPSHSPIPPPHSLCYYNSLSLPHRLDEQIVFHKLGRPEVRTIANLMIRETARRVEERGYSLELSPALVDRIIAEGHSDEYGVRPLRQTVVR